MDYGIMEPEQADEVSALVVDVFSEFVAPDFSAQGVSEFHMYVASDALRRRSEAGDHYVLVAQKGRSIVGALEMRDPLHLSLFFVSREFQGKGIGRELLGRALTLTRSTRRDSQAVDASVLSSPHAVPIYEHFGFVCCGPKKLDDGMLVQPMTLPAESVSSLLSSNQLRVPFSATAWEDAGVGVREKAFISDGQRIRLVQFFDSFVEEDWCTKAHAGYVLDGSFELLTDAGTLGLSAGDGIFIPAGDAHRHKAVVPAGHSVTLVLFEPV